MKQTYTPVVPKRVRLFCDCAGELVWDRTLTMGQPAQFPHVCDCCGAKRTLGESFPHIEFTDFGRPDVYKVSGTVSKKDDEQ